MPDLLADIMSQNLKMPTDGCGISRIMKQMTDVDRKDLEDALNNPNITASAIDRALRKNGWLISGNTVRRHRRKDCACGQTQ